MIHSTILIILCVFIGCVLLLLGLFGGYWCLLWRIGETPAALEPTGTFLTEEEEDWLFQDVIYLANALRKGEITSRKLVSLFSVHAARAMQSSHPHNPEHPLSFLNLVCAMRTKDALAEADEADRRLEAWRQEWRRLGHGDAFDVGNDVFVLVSGGGEKRIGQWNGRGVRPPLLPPLLGVPISIKECIGVKGMPQTGGLASVAFGMHSGGREGVAWGDGFGDAAAVVVARDDLDGRCAAVQDATVVARLRAAGCIVFASTNVSEGCMWYEASNPVWGRSSNPHDARRTTGGSSGGEAALVAMGGSPAGIGSDIGGSIRIPSAFCGVFGHKPSGGLVPGDGQLPFETTRLLTTGPIARSARSLPVLLRLIAGKNETLHADAMCHGVGTACNSLPTPQPHPPPLTSPPTFSPPTTSSLTTPTPTRSSTPESRSRSRSRRRSHHQLPLPLPPRPASLHGGPFFHRRLPFPANVMHSSAEALSLPPPPRVEFQLDALLRIERLPFRSSPIFVPRQLPHPDQRHPFSAGKKGMCKYEAGVLMGSRCDPEVLRATYEVAASLSNGVIVPFDLPELSDAFTLWSEALACDNAASPSFRSILKADANESSGKALFSAWSVLGVLGVVARRFPPALFSILFNAASTTLSLKPTTSTSTSTSTTTTTCGSRVFEGEGEMHGSDHDFAAIGLAAIEPCPRRFGLQSWAMAVLDSLHSRLERTLSAAGPDSVLVMPPMPTVAPPHDFALYRITDAGYGMLWNAIGAPVTVVPLRTHVHSTLNLPLAAAVIATRGNDARTLNAAIRLEQDGIVGTPRPRAVVGSCDT